MSLILNPSTPTQFATNPQVIKTIKYQLAQEGWVLLRGFDNSLDIFSQVLSQLCSKLNFDPAREFCNQSTQKVDAGTHAVGLHIENGNTPIVPDIVAFYSQKSAKHGSQTTVCDGAKIMQQLSTDQLQLFKSEFTMSRVLPKTIWQSYISHEFLDDAANDDVTEAALSDFLNCVPGQSGTLDEQQNLHYKLRIQPLLTSQLGQQLAFANALLGPSYNYQTPVYTFADGSTLNNDLIKQLVDIAEPLTHEVQWQDGDIAIIDNKRVMHGRREILGDLSERELCIGMGNL